MEGFIRGGPGCKAVKLTDILPAQMRGFSTRAQQEPYADAWEDKNGRYVERPWLSEEDNKKAQQLFDAKQKPEQAEVGMAPDRAERQISALWAEFDPNHPSPERLEIVKREINRCEQILGRPVTNFETDAPQKKSQIPEKLANQLKKYLGIKDAKERRRVIVNIKNLPLLRLIRQQEENPEITEVVVKRVAELELE